MYSRRDHLLVLPWEHRKYENHIRKVLTVQSASAAIDNRPPLSRNHVALKSKKKQKEEERCTQIEKNNLILLRKLNTIMQSNRVDNYWTTPQPNFLNRIGLYYDMTPYEKIQKTDQKPQDLSKPPKTTLRKSKCLACTPQPIEEEMIPEARIPWEPEKPPVRKMRSKSVPSQKLESSVKPSSAPTETQNKIKVEKPAQERSRSCKSTKRKNSKIFNLDSPHSIILTRGSLVLSLNFPSDSSVKFKNGKLEKLITPDLCQCKNENLYSKLQVSES